MLSSAYVVERIYVMIYNLKNNGLSRAFRATPGEEPYYLPREDNHEMVKYHPIGG